VTETLYRRPLPIDATAFSSPSGRALFAEALAAGGMDGYFALAEQFHTQSDPAFCGLGSLVVALNALGIDPGRLWKGPWRWFAEEMLDCCVGLDEVRRRGLDLDELACLARCNGAQVELRRPDADGDLVALRASLGRAAHGDVVVIAAYDRAALGQTGSGHASPIGGIHVARDLALVLDVARFKYPPHWVSVERLWSAMRGIDPATNRSRGWLELRRGTSGLALGYSLACDGEDLRGFAHRLTAAVTALAPDAGLAALATALVPFAHHVVLRASGTAAHDAALDQARLAIRQLAAYATVAEVAGAEVESVIILILAIADRLAPATRSAIEAPLLAEVERHPTLIGELGNLRAQIAALWSITSD